LVFVKFYRAKLDKLKSLEKVVLTFH